MYCSIFDEDFLREMTWLTKGCEHLRFEAISNWLTPLALSNSVIMLTGFKPCQERALQKIKCFIECMVIVLTYGEGWRCKATKGYKDTVRKHKPYGVPLNTLHRALPTKKYERW